jgi:hypothetical protein
MKRKKGYRSDREMVELILQIRRDAAAILPMYHRLHRLGEDQARGGEAVRVSGSPNVREDGSVTGYVPETALVDGKAEHHRDSARWVDQQMENVAKTLFIVRQGLEHNVGPAAGYRQPQTLGSDAIVTVDDFHAAVENQAQRLRQGAE